MNPFPKPVISSLVVMLCAGNAFGFGKLYTEPNVTVENNTLLSNTDPKVKLLVNNDLEYIGHVHGEESKQAATSNEYAKVIVDTYIFVGRNPDKRVEKMFTFTVLNHDRPRWIFFNDLPDRINHDRLMDSGKYQIGKHNFYFAAFVGNNYSDTEKDYLRERGYMLPQYFLLKTFEKTVNSTDSVKAIITYNEGLDTFIHKEYNNWRNPSIISDSQKDEMKGFLQRAANSFAEVTNQNAVRSLPPLISVNSTTSTAPFPAFDLDAELRRLQKLKNDNLITEEEYNTLRAKALEKAQAQ